MKYILDLREVNKNDPALVGGKGANLGELTRMDEIRVPEGFCVTTKAYEAIVESNQTVRELLEQLRPLKAGDRQAITRISENIREAIEKIPIPKELDTEIREKLASFDPDTAFAIRSSATAEDLPTASFAGQQDTYLNIIGKDEILKHISACWASLFTERAVSYRIQNGFDHQQVRLAVIVQQLVIPQASGVVFTADPVSFNRKVMRIDAGFGLGEALVSGIVNADNYVIREGKITDNQVPAKKTLIRPTQSGGTKEEVVQAEKQNLQVLTDEHILLLERIGRTVEAHFGSPQDIEWCLAGDQFYLVQSRPITTLFPVPEANDTKRHVYASVGHQQMMTDALKPLGIAIWQLSTFHPMYTAGGRLFVDISNQLATESGRETLLNTLGKSDPLSRDALIHIMERKFIPEQPEDQNTPNPAHAKNLAFRDAPAPDPSLVPQLIEQNLETIRQLNRDISGKSGTALLEFILEDLQSLKQLLFDPQSFAALMTGIHATAWINEKLFEWLGEKNAADTLSQSLDYNVTSEMGLALMDVADVVRSYPEIVRYLEETKNEAFLDELPRMTGGKEVQEAITHYLDKYGMRCPGEIDITKTRWSEKPSILIPLILNNVRNFEPGAAKRKFEQGKTEALEKEAELLARLRQLPDGEQKATETKEQIDRIRNFSGYREFPKYIMISHYFAYKQALMKEAEKLVLAGKIYHKEDIFYLTFVELQEVLHTQQADQELIEQQKEAFKLHEKLVPPRLMTSEGEVISGKYNRDDLPEHALAGLAVSSGIVEGRARVILKLEDAVWKQTIFWSLPLLIRAGHRCLFPSRDW
ncbi:phosphoenolpyruvate synthase [Fluviicola chungangensis]|uniref:phosphoenolpyruvate synthase n=1 Tax=Fluviicola chungangensis TaxID=2597671 RepID=UPI001C91111D|nr:phosphoenolpyruvate synthase [Fluviicola chungangensis]